MNRLWVRLQHVYGSSNKGKKRRERERLELRLLVGGQLSRLSMLSGLDAGIYSSTVLPRILSEIIACRDRIAQPYLFECTLQAFPIDFTFATLPQLLEALPKMVPDSSVAKACLGALFNRIKEEALSATNILQEAAAGGDAMAKAALDSNPKDKRLPGLMLLPSALASSSSSSSSSGGGDKAAATPTPAAASASASAVVNVADLDVFGLLLTSVNELTRDPAGPFRGGATAVKNAANNNTAAASLLNAAGIDEDQTAVSNSSAATPTGTTAATTSSKGPTITAGLASPESLAALLDVYTTLMSFTSACYPHYLPYADSVLEGAAQSMREGLGLLSSADADAESEAAAAAAAEAEKQAQAKRKSALSRLTGGADGDEAGEEASGGGGSKKKKGAAAADEAAATSKSSSSATKKDPLSSVSLDDECSKLVVSLLGAVQQSLGLSVLSLDHYAPLMAPLRFVYRRSIAGRLLDAVLAPSAAASTPATPGAGASSGAAATPAGAAAATTVVRRVANADTARRLLNTLLPLIRDDDSAASAASASSSSGSTMVTITADNSNDEHAFVSEQQRIAKLILILGQTTDKGFNSAMNAAAAAAEAAQAVHQLGDDADADAVAAAKANVSRAQQLASSLTSELDTDSHWEVLKVAAEYLSQGGARRLGYTFPPLVFACLQLLRRVRSLELAGKRGLKTNYRRGYEFLLNLIAALAASHNPAAAAAASGAGSSSSSSSSGAAIGSNNNDLALRLCLQACLSIDVGSSEICEAFASQAFLCYEEITDSKQQAASLALIISTLQELKALEVDKYESLVSRATLHSVKLLKKQDQVKCVLLCSKLFWRSALPGMEPVPAAEGAASAEGEEGAMVAPQFYHQPKELLQCLQKALSIADKAVPPQPSLFVQCFEAYIGHFERGVPSVQAQHITDLIALCKEQVEGMRIGSSDREELASHLKAVLGHITRAKAAAATSGAGSASSATAAAAANARYADVVLP
jgi:Vacuolar protein sorting-associated protein 35